MIISDICFRIEEFYLLGLAHTIKNILLPNQYFINQIKYDIG